MACKIHSSKWFSRFIPFGLPSTITKSHPCTAWKVSKYGVISGPYFPHLDWIRRDTAGKVSKYGVISGPYFPAFGLNTESYGRSLRTQSACVKIRTRNNSVFGHFSRSVALYVFFGIFPKYWISYISEHLKYVNI